MKVVSTKEMSKLDRKTIENAGIPEEILMEKAGTETGREALEFIKNISEHIRRIVILAGKGNNGGDAYAAAKYLSEHTGYEMTIYSICDLSKLKGVAKHHCKLVPQNIKITHKSLLSETDFKKGDIIIDALLGTGFNGKLESQYLEWIRTVNSSNCPVIAVDIPSGLNGDTGIVEEEAITADITITVALPKVGLLVNNGPEHCGIIKIADIGIPREYTGEIESYFTLFTKDEASSLIRRVPFCCNKKSRGTVLVIGGSPLYSGAPFLAGNAALKTGAGLVTVAIPESAGIQNSNILSLITRKIKDSGDGVFDHSSINGLKTLAEQHDSIVIGPGMSTDKKCVKVMEEILRIDKPTVIDADALNLLALNSSILSPNSKFVYTPHSGEAARLLSGLDLSDKKPSDRIELTKMLLSKLDGTVVLKGCRSIVANKNNPISFNGSGTPSLATAGSGDVLSGMIAAFLASGIPAFDAARLAVYVHGLIGELKNRTMRGLSADDMTDVIPEALKFISPFA